MKDAFDSYGSTGDETPSPAANKTPITEEGSPEGQGDSIHIPAEFLQGTKFKPGDELVLKVVSADDEGVEVEYAATPKEESAEGEGSGMSADDEIDSMAKDNEM